MIAANCEMFQQTSQESKANHCNHSYHYWTEGKPKPGLLIQSI